MRVVEVGQYFVTKDTGDFRQFHSVACREYTLPRDDRASQPKGWIQGNMRIGPVLEVTTSFQHFKYGIEIRTESVNKDDSNSWVRISYGTVKYVIDSIEDNTEIPADHKKSKFHKHAQKWLQPGQRQKQNLNQEDSLGRQQPRNARGRNEDPKIGGHFQCDMAVWCVCVGFLWTQKWYVVFLSFAHDNFMIGGCVCRDKRCHFNKQQYTVRRNGARHGCPEDSRVSRCNSVQRPPCGPTQPAPCVCLGGCAIKRARIRTAMHTEWLRRGKLHLLLYAPDGEEAGINVCVM